ncbi:MAG: hypothetical protein OXD46_06395 [Chloroflexi bacterium]|nr:hypothetical protein [Chloroflexota bacterium]
MAGTVGVTSDVNADDIYVGSLVIARATMEAVRRDAPELVTIVAMGDGGKVRTDEDEQCALYMRNLLEGRNPDPDAVRSLVMACDQAAKYDDPAKPHFRREDRETALQIDSVSFAIKVSRQDGMLVSRPVDPRTEEPLRSLRPLAVKSPEKLQYRHVRKIQPDSGPRGACPAVRVRR